MRLSTNTPGNNSHIFFVQVVSDPEVDSRPLPRAVIILFVSSRFYAGLQILSPCWVRGNSGPRALVSSLAAGGGHDERSGFHPQCN